MNLLAVLRELVCEEARIMGSDWTGYHRVPPQRDAWHPPAVFVEQAVVEFASTLAQHRVTGQLVFLADVSRTDVSAAEERIYAVLSTDAGGLAEQLADVVSPNGLWTSISIETGTISYREFGQNTYLAATVPVQMLCPHAVA